MKQVGIFEAKTHLSNLVDDVAKGEEIVITRHGKPVARLVRAENPHSAEAIERRRKAMIELREMARKRGVRISHEEIKSWVEDGRH